MKNKSCDLKNVGKRIRRKMETSAEIPFRVCGHSIDANPVENLRDEKKKVVKIILLLPNH